MLRIICPECKNAYLQNKGDKLICSSCGKTASGEEENFLSGVQYYNEGNLTEAGNCLMKYIVKNGAQPHAIFYKALCDGFDFDEDTTSLKAVYEKMAESLADISDEAFPIYVALANDEAEKLEKALVENHVRLFADADSEKIKKQVATILGIQKEASEFREKLTELVAQFNERSSIQLSAKFSDCYFVESEIATEVGNIKYQKICENIASHTVFTGILSNDIKNLEIYYRCIVMFFQKSHDKYDFLLAESAKFFELTKILEEGQYNTIKGTSAIGEKLKSISYDFLEESYKEHFDEQIDMQTETIVIIEPEAEEPEEVEEKSETTEAEENIEASEDVVEVETEEPSEETVVEEIATIEIAVEDNAEEAPEDEVPENEAAEEAVEESTDETATEEIAENVADEPTEEVSEDETDEEPAEDYAVIEIEEDTTVEIAEETTDNSEASQEAEDDNGELTIKSLAEVIAENKNANEPEENTDSSSDGEANGEQAAEAVSEEAEEASQVVSEEAVSDDSENAEETEAPEESNVEEEAEKPKKKKKKSKKCLIIFLIIVIACIGALGYKYTPEIINSYKYKQAIDLYEDGSFSQAADAFKELGNYNDSAEKYNAAAYNTAVELEESGKHAEARAIFESLGEYEDCVTRVKACIYSEATATLEEKNFDAAAKLFEEIKDYADSDEKIKECSYQKALSLLDEKQYESAVEILAKLGKYSDSADKIKEAKYMYITDNFDKKNKTTVKYLKELAKSSYRNTVDLQKELLGDDVATSDIKAFVNYDSTDLKTELTKLDNTKKIYFHAIVNDKSLYGKALTLKYTTAFGYSQSESVTVSESKNSVSMVYPSTQYKNYTVEFQLLDSNGTKLAGQTISF